MRCCWRRGSCGNSLSRRNAFFFSVWSASAVPPFSLLCLLLVQFLGGGKICNIAAFVSPVEYSYCVPLFSSPSPCGYVADSISVQVKILTMQSQYLQGVEKQLRAQIHALNIVKALLPSWLIFSKFYFLFVFSSLSLLSGSFTKRRGALLRCLLRPFHQSAPAEAVAPKTQPPPSAPRPSMVRFPSSKKKINYIFLSIASSLLFDLLGCLCD